MFAVNAITNKYLVLFLAIVTMASVVASPVDSCGAIPQMAPENSANAEQLNKLTGNKGPEAGPNSSNGSSSGGEVNVEVVSLLALSDEGEKFGYPAALYSDKEMGETYVITSNKGGRIIVYGENFFPEFSLGPGRGAYAPRALDIDANGLLYVAQSRTETDPPKISVYNAAFFKEKDIILDNIDGIDGTFLPTSLKVKPNGFIYISGANNRGVIVLRQEDGTFSHWLRPLDLIFDQDAIASFKQETDEGDDQAEEEEGEQVQKEKKYEMDLYDLFDQLMPKQSQDAYPLEAEPDIGPVKVNSLEVDSNGNIYVLSPETSKVYVYNSAEEFLFSFGEKGGSAGKLSRPRSLVVDEKKNAIYIVDYMRHSVLIYDRSGRFMYEFGGLGNSPGWFRYPTNLSLNRDGLLLVSDLFNNRVQVLDVDFKYSFPLFQVPFVQEEIYKPQPLAQQGGQPDRYFAPGGFESGQQASVEMSPEKAIYKELDDNVL